MKYLLIIAIGFIVCACVGAPTVDGQPAITVVAEHLNTFSTALSAALQDGVVTPEEAASIQSLFQALGGKITIAMSGAGGVPWAEMLATAGVSIVGSLLGVKVLPGAALQGPFDRRGRAA